MNKLFQPYHLVTLSPWPILCSFSVMMMMVGFMNWFNNLDFMFLMLGFMIVVIVLIQWWRDVIRESTFQGFHTYKVLSGLKMGMILFIISEVFFFISIFWAYFHMFLSPSIEIGEIWPPKNINMFNPYHIPLLNTIILLSSGVMVTWCHYSILNQLKFNMLISMALTILLGIVFTMFQYLEYISCSYTISDSVFGSIFFMATGFHGIHVLIGTIFLFINFIRMCKNNYSSIHHFGFEAAAWYCSCSMIIFMFISLFLILLIFN